MEREFKYFDWLIDFITSWHWDLKHNSNLVQVLGCSCISLRQGKTYTLRPGRAPAVTKGIFRTVPAQMEVQIQAYLGTDPTSQESLSFSLLQPGTHPSCLPLLPQTSVLAKLGQCKLTLPKTHGWRRKLVHDPLQEWQENSLWHFYNIPRLAQETCVGSRHSYNCTLVC